MRITNLRKNTCQPRHLGSMTYSAGEMQRSAPMVAGIPMARPMARSSVDPWVRAGASMVSGAATGQISELEGPEVFRVHGFHKGASTFLSERQPAWMKYGPTERNHGVGTPEVPLNRPTQGCSLRRLPIHGISALRIDLGSLAPGLQRPAAEGHVLQP